MPHSRKETSMSDSGSNARLEKQACPYSAASEFERAVNMAQDLLDESDLDGALKVLNALEAGYMSGTRLFDLLGDVFLRKGEVEEGIRYKTLHEVLKGTFKIATQRRTRGSEEQGIATVEGAAPTTEAESDVPEFPVTVAMAQEFMRQGHYDRAAKVFAKLSRMHPEDTLLQDAEYQARKKCGEKDLVGILKRWLGNIDRLRLDKAGGV
jgi:hypothetical protein